MSDPQLFRDVSLGSLTDEILRDLARNGATQYSWRVAAVELLLDRHSHYADHPDLALFTQQIRAQRAAKDEVQAMVETAIEAPLDDEQNQGCVDGFKAGIQAGLVKEIPTLKDLAKEIPQSAGPFKASFTTQSM